MEEKKTKKKKLTLSVSSNKPHKVPNYTQSKGKTSVVIEKKAPRRWGEKKFQPRDNNFNKPKPTGTFVPKKPLINRNVDISADYVKSRENYYELIEKGKIALDGILEVAQEGEHPRSYEVVGQILKNVSELNTQLIDLQKSMAELEAIEKKGNPTKVTNALFVGSTTDLQKLLKNGGND